jgi:hypothetical protein
MLSINPSDLFQFKSDIKRSYIGSGNRCGHDPEHPNFEMIDYRVVEKNNPITQVQLMHSVKRYYKNPMLLPSLYHVNGTKNKDGNYRSNRTCVRDAHVQILMAIISLTDFVTLKIGVPCANGDFIDRDFGHIAKMVDMLHKSSTKEKPVPSRRFYRKISDFKKAGILKVDQQFTHVSGEFELNPNGKLKPKIRASYSIKSLSQDFLLALGVVSAKNLKIFRDHCSNGYTAKREAFKRKNKHHAESLEARKRLKFKSSIGGTVKEAVNAVNLNESVKKKPVSPADKQAYALARIEISEALRSKNPERAKDFPWMKKRLEELLPPIEVWLATKQRR